MPSYISKKEQDECPALYISIFSTDILWHSIYAEATHEPAVYNLSRVLYHIKMACKVGTAPNRGLMMAQLVQGYRWYRSSYSRVHTFVWFNIEITLKFVA